MPVTTTTPLIQLNSRQPQLAAGSWRVDPARSQATFDARVAGYRVQGSLPLAGGAIITEPVENSTARLVARTSAVSTGSPALDRLLTGPSFLDARTFPEIIFQSDLLAWVPAGWRAVGQLRVKDSEHELACQLDVHPADTRPGALPRIIVTSRWVIDARWVTSRRIPGLGRRIVMTCSFSLEPDM
jgi:polyisoprenoid-binding protein YceI